MHRWVEPHGDLTACGIRWWNGTRGEEQVTCAACLAPPPSCVCSISVTHEPHFYVSIIAGTPGPPPQLTCICPGRP